MLGKLHNLASSPAPFMGDFARVGKGREKDVRGHSKQENPVARMRFCKHNSAFDAALHRAVEKHDLFAHLILTFDKVVGFNRIGSAQ